MREEVLQMQRDNAASQLTMSARQIAADARQKWSHTLSAIALGVSIVMGIVGPIAVEGIKRQLGWTSPITSINQIPSSDASTPPVGATAH